jgi:hypothetical protein
MEKKKNIGGGPMPQVSLEMELYERKDNQKLDRYRFVKLDERGKPTRKAA